MDRFSRNDWQLSWHYQHETVCIEAWGTDSLRVRASMDEILPDLPGALPAQSPQTTPPLLSISPEGGTIENGKIRATIDPQGQLSFYHSPSGRLLLTEGSPHAVHAPARWFRPHSGSPTWHLAVTFQPNEGEKLYGLGQHLNGRLNQKGCVIDLLQLNTEVCIPFLISNRGYGFLWNNPALGRVELAENGTRWVASSTRQMDYFITAGDTPAELLEHYTAAVGRAPHLPDFAAGFWQSRLRYGSQQEVLAVAREYKRRGLPIDVLVIDAGYWHEMGSYAFDPAAWPDPGGMIAELQEMGIHVMVSVWPTINKLSPTYAEMEEQGLLTRSDRGNPAHIAHLMDTRPQGGWPILTHYDPTHPAARELFWKKIRETLYSQGIRLFWLDADEPELIPRDYDALRYHLGSGSEVGLLFPLMHQRTFYDGLKAEGELDILMLSRSAWAGSQKYGAAVWSGDVPSTFDSLHRQIAAGLNIGMSGIPWWTSDIGGFIGGNVNDPGFRELIVRWFQFGVFCPLFRLHGFREPIPVNWMEGGAANEVWSFGEPAYTILSHLLRLRERFKPYILHHMNLASENGLSIMRPLFMDFPADAACWEVEDSFMFGSDLLVAPITRHDQHERQVYLPAAVRWTDAWTGETFAGSQTVTVLAPLDHIPAFWREGSQWEFLFSAV